MNTKPFNNPTTRSAHAALARVHAQLRVCRKCSGMCGSAVHGAALNSRVMLVGQAPGTHESSLGRPFAYTAGKTLFKWLKRATGNEEEVIRELVYFTAVARCFPGKAASGSGDRLPSKQEVENCREHLVTEVQAIQPDLLLAVGRLAISEILGPELFGKSSALADVVGKKFEVEFHGVNSVVIPLPHPSGVSRWPQTEPGKSKLSEALKLVEGEFQRIEATYSLLRG